MASARPARLAREAAHTRLAPPVKGIGVLVTAAVVLELAVGAGV